MADQFDLAQELDAHYRQQALLHHQTRLRQQGDSRTHCLECSDEIPEKRREAMPGCQLCAECQETKERFPGGR